ncbi:MULTISPECIES: ABC transporter substrate-binding protein [Halococcus]|uniref:ABC transporter substrate-binding protein n=1 Tax=Halococcus TaxID=2249 RepID=UPI000678164E|nr:MULTISPECIES: ABC transporter substrate-binding protein [Halococcus]
MRRSNKPPASADRRRFIKYAGAAGVTGLASLAGCSSDDAGGSGENGSGGGGDGGGQETTGGEGTEGGEETTGGSGNNSEGGTTSGSAGGSTEEVLIGSNHPLSGSLASTGVGMNNAIKLAAQRKNEAGGIESLGGAQVRVLEGDNQGQQELGGQVTQELIDEGAKVVSGCFASPVTTAATQVAERRQTPFVISVAAATDILRGRGFNYVYRPQPPARRMAMDYANLVPEVIRQNGGEIGTAGLFYVNNSYGQSINENLKRSLPENGVEVVTETALELGASSANTQVSKLKQADPDTVIATTYVPGGVTLVDAMQNQSYRPPYLTACASATFTDDAAVSDVGEFANGVLDNNYALNPTVDKTQEVREQFNSSYEGSFSASVGMAYTAGEVIIEAIEQAGSTEREAINGALQSLTYKDHIAAMGPITFQDNGENENALAAVNQVQDGTINVVYPEEFAGVEPIVESSSN